MASDIADLINRYDTRAGAIKDFSAEDVREIFRDRNLNLERDTLLIVKDEVPIAYAMLWPMGPDAHVVAFGVVDPKHWGRGLGSHLVDFLCARAEEIQRERGKELTVRLHIETGDEPANELARSRGFEVVRGNFTMHVEFDDEPIRDEAPEWLTIRTCTLDDSKLCHDLVEETFAEHFGHTPRSFEEWEQGLSAREDFDPTLWWIAYDGDEPTGLLLGYKMGDMGWVADLGVRKCYRKRGIAATLLRHAFAEFQRRGMTSAGLGVDSQNETGAVALYESVGMHVAKSYRTYERKFS